MRKPVCQFAVFKNCSFIFLFLQNPRAFPRPSGRLFVEKAVKRRILGGFLGSTGFLHKIFSIKNAPLRQRDALKNIFSASARFSRRFFSAPRRYTGSSAPIGPAAQPIAPPAPTGCSRSAVRLKTPFCRAFHSAGSCFTMTAASVFQPFHSRFVRPDRTNLSFSQNGAAFPG